jgi:hypothetical protein
MKPSNSHTTRVRFLEGPEGTLSGLVVEAPANHPLHQLIGTLIANAGLHIVWRETRLAETGFQRFALSAIGGGRVPEGARLKLQQGLVSYA